MTVAADLIPVWLPLALLIGIPAAIDGWYSLKHRNDKKK